ncbi:MAG: hypothetical protein FWF69_09670 [Firmicutes bacterium]|nr:hypothetical protein [Bacillota bacterium]
MIAWAYLDKKAAAVDALKDYVAMEFIIINHEDVEKELRESMTSVRSSSPAGMPYNPDLKRGEARIAARIDEIDILKERYRSAVEYMAWFKPAWDELKEEEQIVLSEFYLHNDNSQEDSVGRICNRFRIERSSAYNKKNRALARLTILLYGR